MSRFKVRTREVVEKTYYVDAESPEEAEEYALEHYVTADEEYFDDWYVLEVEDQG